MWQGIRDCWQHFANKMREHQRRKARLCELLGRQMAMKRERGYVVNALIAIEENESRAFDKLYDVQKRYRAQYPAPPTPPR